MWSAGNNGDNTDNFTNIKQFNVPNLISVGAVLNNGTRSSSSNFGINSVNVFAPTNTLSTNIGNTYRVFGGTSCAAPHVAGVAALLLTANSTLTPSQIKQIILQNVDTGPYDCTSGGRLNAYKALKASVTIVNMRTIQLAAPMAGVAPVRTVDTVQYNGTVEWLPNHTTFVDGTNYTATVTLVAKDGYTLHGITTGNYFTVTGSLSASYDDSTGKVIADMGATLFAGGTGTQSNPYLIKTITHLNNIRLSPNSHFKLENNIIFEYVANNWQPVPEFNGNFNGSGYKITHMKILATTAGNYGFVAVNNGIIRNLTIYGCVDAQNEAYAGMFAGVNNGTISQCNSQASYPYAMSPMIQAIPNQILSVTAGGIAGYNTRSGLIESCQNYGVMHDVMNMGGITGYNMGRIDRCHNYAFILYKSTPTSVNIGGIAGIQNASQGGISSSKNHGVLRYYCPSSTSVTLEPAIAQIVGDNYSGYLQSNTWSGTVDSSTLITIGNHNQALYVGNREVGRQN